MLIFARLLLNKMPPPPSKGAGRVVLHLNTSSSPTAALEARLEVGEEQRNESRQLVRMAMRLGARTRKAICTAAELSPKTVQSRLDELIEDGEVVMVGDEYFPKEKK